MLFFKVFSLIKFDFSFFLSIRVGVFIYFYPPPNLRYEPKNNKSICLYN